MSAPRTDWMQTPVRLVGLLFCLGVLVFALVAKGGGNAAGSSPDRDACVAGMPSVQTVGLNELVKLRATLRGVMASAGGRRYEGGIAAPAAFWTDASPQGVAAAREAHGTWPARYEIRQWSQAGDDVVADAFRFRSHAQARALFDAASVARCHRRGFAMPVASPPQTRALVWLNPDAAVQADAFLLRGATVYRVAVVRGRPSPRSAPRLGAGGVANGLACQLPGAGCVAAPKTPRTRGASAAGD
ncbi:MAG TPA: hypothetical protein VL988_09095 [Solirubrobacteraceae bacterium]|nr:hypothetical protein [Solirubrobacteraceae bacterium]